jgi:hypothetical protein
MTMELISKQRKNDVLVGRFNSERKEGYGSIDNYRKYFETNQQRQFHPLLQPVNFRVKEGRGP